MKFFIKVKIFLVLFEIFTFLLNSVNCLNDFYSAEYNLFQKLFTNYSKSVRPVKLWNDTLDVFVNINLKKLANVVEMHQTALIYVGLEMTWTDVNLKWEPKDYENIDSIVLPAEKIWIPDLHLFNSAAENDRIYPSNVEIYSNGTIQTYPINQLYAHCDFDFSNFPYDTQTCDFMIGNVVDKSKVKIWTTVNINETKLSKNNEWSFVSLKEKPEFELTVPGTSDEHDFFSADWSVTKFSLTFKRNSKFFVNLFIWPLIFILFVTTSVFILPPNCVERASMGVLLILTLVIISLMLDSYTPKNTTNISVIGRLIAFSMFMVTWSTFVSTLIIGIDKDNFTYRQIPVWLKNLMLNYIGKLTLKYGTLKKTLMSDLLNREEEIEVLDTNQYLNSDSNVASTSNSTKESLDINQSKTLLALISNQLANFRTRIQEKDNREQNKKDWYIIACALDRFFLIVYFVLLVLGLFIIFI